MPKVKLAWIIKLGSERLAVIHQLFSWTSAGPFLRCPIDNDQLSEESPDYHVYQLRTLSQNFFGKWVNFKIGHSKKFYCLLCKTLPCYQTMIHERLTIFHQLFSWTLVGPSKCPIDKKIGSQGYLRVWGVLSNISLPFKD